jgi:hypothetical protein
MSIGPVSEAFAQPFGTRDVLTLTRLAEIKCELTR